MALPFWDPLSPSVAEGPIFAPDPWDTCFIGGKRLPGICRVKGLPTLAFDKKKAGGVDGATITVNGYLPGPIDVECTIWTDDQWAEFQRIGAAVWRRPNKKTSAKQLAVTIDHPALALWGISSVVVLGVSVPEDGGTFGTKVIKIKCVEFVAQENKPKTSTAKGAVNFGAVDPHFDPAKNRAGDPPSKTDGGPKGPAVSKKGGVS